MRGGGHRTRRETRAFLFRIFPSPKFAIPRRVRSLTRVFVAAEANKKNVRHGNDDGGWRFGADVKTGFLPFPPVRVNK